jgi:hypothetical protein
VRVSYANPIDLVSGGAVVVVAMVTAMMVGLGKSGRAEQQDHGEQQSLFHDPNHNPDPRSKNPQRVTLLGYAVSPWELRFLWA